MNRFMMLLACVVVAMLMPGCAMSQISVRNLDTGVLAGPPSKTPVPVYQGGVDTPPRSVMRFAVLLANGNGYSNNDTLKRDMAIKGASIGADCVLVGGTQVYQAGSVYSFSGGIGMGAPVYAAAMQGTACRWAPVKIGILRDANGIITDVVPGSAAARAGIRIGDRLLAINSVRLTSNELAFDRAIAGMVPGKSCPFELVSSDNSTRTLQVVPDPNN